MNIAVTSRGYSLDERETVKNLFNDLVGEFWPEGVMTAMGTTNISAAYLEPRSSLVGSPVKGALERLPHLAARIQALWGETEFEPYVNRLLMESRDGNRQGLPWDVAQELFFLAEFHIARRALAAAETTGRPFPEMFAQCLARSVNPAPTGPTVIHGWSDPMANKDARRMKRNDT